DHVSGFLSDQAEEIISLTHLAANAPDLILLIYHVDIEQKNQADQSAHGKTHVQLVEPGEGRSHRPDHERGDPHREEEGYKNCGCPEPPLPLFDLTYAKVGGTGCGPAQWRGVFCMREFD